MTSEKIVTVYITLLDEGSPTIRPTTAIDLGNGLFKLLPTERYNPENETWEFLPGTTVKVTPYKTSKGDVLLAVQKAI